MKAARIKLINADPVKTKVSGIALRYGFTELCRFSIFYKENPSETLRI